MEMGTAKQPGLRVRQTRARNEVLGYVSITCPPETGNRNITFGLLRQHAAPHYPAIAIPRRPAMAMRISSRVSSLLKASLRPSSPLIAQLSPAAPIICTPCLLASINPTLASARTYASGIASSKRWTARQVSDPYTRAAKAEQLRSRAGFKLMQVQSGGLLNATFTWAKGFCGS